MDRRTFLTAASAALVARQAAAQAPARQWQSQSLTEAGFKPDASERIEKAFAAGELKGLHGLVVLRHGKIAMEHYFSGADEIWGDSRGTVAFNADELHDLRSVSKSIVGLIYGIALGEGLVPKPAAPVLASFPDYRDLAADADRQRIKIEHVLTMSMGLAWDESLPYTDPRNSEIAMERAADRYRFILEQPITRPPGEAWTYSGGATALLGHLVARGSGQRLGTYASSRLFAPLGIERFTWTNGMNGEEAAASGLRLRPRDLAAIGQLLLDKGHYGGRQIIPADWVEQALTERSQRSDGLRYGYQWYLGRDRAGDPWYGAEGNGGQRLIVAPKQEIVIAVTAGNYNQPGNSRLPLRVAREFVFGALAS
ncbi:serine hydrolase domain-containing protein [Bosea robiniae]|uniref:CubicO group peptidase, beta-lactamase class C family n=1 Tax=Bosea robiniae TaxID=1036780 RepID=A0ABY0NIS8_9HYPH|nr:serine hydrolase [Bosea robiniae]SDF56120.1 CubicO group peptidase, beta-lactamase class C family [Bosea robiniae]